MMGSVKLIISLVLSVSLLLSFSLLFLNAEAQVTFEKVKTGDNHVRIQSVTGTPFMDLELLENTDQCLVDCYAVIRIHPYQDISLPGEENSEFAWDFIKTKSWMEDLVSHHFEILETTEYFVEVPEYEEVQVDDFCHDEENTTTYECQTERVIQTGSHQEKRYKSEYVLFKFWGESLKAENDYYIKIAGKKKAKLQASKIDWIPIVKGLEINEWDWWNSSWEMVRPINVWMESGYTGNNYQLFVNLTNNTNFKADWGDVRFTDDDNTTELDYWMDADNCFDSNYCEIWINVSDNITASNTTIWMWYNNSNAVNASDGDNTFLLFDYFDYTGSPDSNKWNEFTTLPGTVFNWVLGNKNRQNQSGGHVVQLGSKNSFPYPFVAVLEMYAGTYPDTSHIFNPIGVGNGSMMLNMRNQAWVWYRNCKWSGKIYGQDVGYGNACTDSGTKLFDISSALITAGSWHTAKVLMKSSTNSSWYFDNVFKGSANPSGLGVATDYVSVISLGNSQYQDSRRVKVRKFPECTTGYEEPLYSFGDAIENSCPGDNTYVSESKTYQAKLCNVADADGNGVIIINASDVVLDCNGMILVGNNSGKAIKILGNFNNITIKRCDIRNYEIGIYSNSNNNHTIFNNTFINNEKGMSLFYSNNNNISKNIITNQSSYGVSLGPYSNGNVLENNDISNNGNIGFIIIWSNDTWICNNNIKDNSPYDIRIGDIAYESNQEPSVNNTFLNVTYDSIHLMNYGELRRQWYLNVNVTDRYMNPVENAVVDLYNATEDLQWSKNTSSNGLTGWNTFTQYVQRNESGTMEFVNQTPFTITTYHPNFKLNSTTQNISECKVIQIVLSKFNITFNITSGEDGSELDNVNINCNYTGFDQDGDTTNTYGPYEFPPGSWWCKFAAEGYFNETVMFKADSDKIINIIMDEQAYLTIQEHNWLEAIYDCLFSGDCLALNLLLEINESTAKTWNQFKRTDQTIVSNEEFISKTVNSTNNITISYTVNIPTKEGYGLIEGIQGYDDFLPIRMHYWFLDETNTSCYSQGNYSIALAEPYCQPLTVYTVGQINTQMNFTVDLRPNLPAGIYYIVRNLEIDPDSVWIDYGQEVIGQIEIYEDSKEAKASVRSKGKILEEAALEGQEGQKESKMSETQPSGDKTSGMTTVYHIDNFPYLATIISIITLILVGLIYKNSRKRVPWS